MNFDFAGSLRSHLPRLVVILSGLIAVAGPWSRDILVRALTTLDSLTPNLDIVLPVGSVPYNWLSFLSCYIPVMYVASLLMAYWGALAAVWVYKGLHKMWESLPFN